MLQNDFVALQNHFAALQNHFAAPKGQIVTLQSSFAAPKNDFFALQNHFSAPRNEKTDKNLETKRAFLKKKRQNNELFPDTRRLNVWRLAEKIIMPTGLFVKEKSKKNNFVKQIVSGSLLLICSTVS